MLDSFQLYPLSHRLWFQNGAGVFQIQNANEISFEFE
jgi:hypothetical protein